MMASVKRQGGMRRQGEGVIRSATWGPGSTSAPKSPVSPPIGAVNTKAPNCPVFLGDVSHSTFVFINNGTVPNKGMADQHQSAQTAVTTNKVMMKWEGKVRESSFGEQMKKLALVDDIAAFSDNEIVALDRRHTQLITFYQDSKQEVFSQEMPLTLTNPSHICVSKDDHIIVLDVQKVKFFRRGYPYLLRHFEPGRNLGNPSCLASDDKNRIAVGYEDTNKISLHSSDDGSLIKELSAPKIGEQLTAHENHFIYITKDKRKLLAVDIDGNFVFSAVIHSSVPESKAHGLCCDSHGNIYVTVHAGQLLEGDIQYFSPDGRYKGHVERIAFTPAGITFTPAGALALAAEGTVKIFPSWPEILSHSTLRRNERK
ncbi:uncharacterized protein LOC110986360 [Acanthaster planci]|uniref:Uncharacterized protein LOC110986360 n=1 Tax=Acanthaster planci TaxID=133434 RepID=A0A8B7ZG73_ACAPL|nr:uncharacterized protein LOC110986360 [Acanthaster planci]XP_022103866.1 uncharacterized protein LOC110986360 [Acanthaster planci]XP_022103867.1 uncharacterized protein LOC110986360 [Acanthaster planci]